MRGLGTVSVRGRRRVLLPLACLQYWTRDRDVPEATDENESFHFGYVGCEGECEGGRAENVVLAIAQKLYARSEAVSEGYLVYERHTRFFFSKRM